MKLLLIAFAVFTTASCTLSSDQQFLAEYLNRRQALDKLEQIETKIEAICPGKGEKFIDALSEVKECADEIDENKETICSVLRNHFPRCSKPMVDFLKECLPDEADDVPQLAFDMIRAGANHLCKTDGEHIFELANVCAKKSDIRNVRCERRLRTKMQQYRNKLPDKGEICSVFTSMKPCLHEHLTRNCGNAITREAFEQLFDALLVPCQSGQRALNEVEVEVFDDKNGI